MAADAPVTFVPEQTTEVVAEERAVREERATTKRWSPVAVVIWAMFAAGLVLFVAFARVPIAAGWRQGRSMSVLDIWSLFVSEVAMVAGPFVTPSLITALVVVILAGSLVCLWLAMTVTSERQQDRPD